MGKNEQGLEISVIAIVEVETHLSYSLSVQQTPSRPTTKLPKKNRTVAQKKHSKNWLKNKHIKAQP